MKIYTEVIYTWDDEKNELVKESEKSFDYEGELVLCWPKIGNPLKKAADNLGGIISDNDPGIDLDPRTSDINVPDVGTPNIPIPNIDAPGGSFTDVSGGLSLLTNNIGYVAGGIVGGKDRGGVMGALDRLAKAGKEALTGEGGYVDDQPGEPPGPGPTGFEAATAQRTLLTGQRRKGAGRTAHAGSGSAGRV